MSFGVQSRHPVLLEVGIRSALMQLQELRQQTSIGRSSVQSIALDPKDSSRLAFHLATGWSGDACKVTLFMSCSSLPTLFCLFLLFVACCTLGKSDCCRLACPMGIARSCWARRVEKYDVSCCKVLRPMNVQLAGFGLNYQQAGISLEMQNT